MINKAFMGKRFGVEIIITSQETYDAFYQHHLAVTFFKKEVFVAAWKTGIFGPYACQPHRLGEVTRFQVRWFGRGRALTEGVVTL